MPDISISTQRRDKSMLLKLLPAPALDKRAGIERDREDGKALSQAAYEKQEELRLEHGAADHERRRLYESDDHFQRTGYGLRIETQEDLGGGNYKTTMERDLPRLEAADEKVRALAEVLARHQERFTKASEARTVAGQILSNINEFLEALPPDAALAMHPAVTATPRKNETIPVAVERVRATLDEFASAKEAAEAAPPHSADMKKTAAAYLHHLSTQDPPQLSGFREKTLEIFYPHMPISLSTVTPVADGAPMSGYGTARVPNVSAILAWLMPDQFLAALNRDIDAIADDENALTDEQRAARIAELEAETLAIERIEESLIEQAGGQVARRGDADVRAALGLADRPMPAGDTTA